MNVAERELEGWNITWITQPSQSPDPSILDLVILAFFKSKILEEKKVARLMIWSQAFFDTYDETHFFRISQIQ